MDVREASMRTTLFGTTWESPIFICPCGYHKAFHPQGELATARAARARKSLMLLSTVTTMPVEDVNREYGASVWYQLYATSSWAVTERLVKRAEAAGCPVLVWTIDLMAGPQHRNPDALPPAGHPRMRHVPRLRPRARRRWRDTRCSPDST